MRIFNINIHILGRVTMKAKLNLTIEEDRIPQSKEYARSRGISLSRLVEQLLQATTEKPDPSFSSRWRGLFKATKHDDPRFHKLMERFLS